MVPERSHRGFGTCSAPGAPGLVGWILLSHRDSGLSAVKAASGDAETVEEASHINAGKSVDLVLWAVKRGAVFHSRGLPYS